MADEKIPEDILESISLNGVVSIASQPAVLSNLHLGNVIQSVNQAQQNAVSMQQTQNSLQATVLGKVVDNLMSLGPLEAACVQSMLAGNLTDSLGGLGDIWGPGPVRPPPRPHGPGPVTGGTSHGGCIIPGQPGSSIERSITHGTVTIDPSPDGHVHLIITDRRPAQPGMGPPYPIRSGEVYIYDNPDENVNVIMKDGNVKVTRI